MLYVVFNNKNSLEDLGLGIVTSNEHYSTKEVIENITVEGRKSGTLTKKTGTFEDIVIKRTFRIIDQEDYNTKSLKILKWLNEIENNKLYFSNYTEKCYIVKYAILESFKDDKTNIINFDISFNCEPFLRDTNEVYEEYTNNSTIYNFGTEESEPNIRLTLPSNSQTIQITIGDKTLEVRNVKNDLFIDVANFRAISEGVEVKTIGNFLVIPKGQSTLSWTGDINKFEMIKNTLYRR